MTEFQFINDMSTEHRITVIANDLIAYANRQYHLDVHKANARIKTRAAIRLLKQQDRETALDIAVRVAIAIGIVAAGWFLTAIGAM